MSYYRKTDRVYGAMWGEIREFARSCGGEFQVRDLPTAKQRYNELSKACMMLTQRGELRRVKQGVGGGMHTPKSVYVMAQKGTKQGDSPWLGKVLKDSKRAYKNRPAWAKSKG